MIIYGNIVQRLNAKCIMYSISAVKLCRTTSQNLEIKSFFFPHFKVGVIQSSSTVNSQTVLSLPLLFCSLSVGLSGFMRAGCGTLCKEEGMKAAEASGVTWRWPLTYTQWEWSSTAGRRGWHDSSCREGNGRGTAHFQFPADQASLGRCTALQCSIHIPAYPSSAEAPVNQRKSPPAEDETVVW